VNNKELHGILNMVKDLQELGASPLINLSNSSMKRTIQSFPEPVFCTKVKLELIGTHYICTGIKTEVFTIKTESCAG
jgi:hypothetical protein